MLANTLFGLRVVDFVDQLVITQLAHAPGKVLSLKMQAVDIFTMVAVEGLGLLLDLTVNFLCDELFELLETLVSVPPKVKSWCDLPVVLSNIICSRLSLLRCGGLLQGL